MAKDSKQRFGSAFEVYASLLAAADAAGIPRRQLRLVESLFDDPAYTIVHEGNREPDAGAGARPAPRTETPLRWLAMVLLLIVVGVALGRWTAPSAPAAASAASVEARVTASRIIVSQPVGDFVMLDRTQVWKKVPTSFDAVTPGKHRLHFGQPNAIRTTVPVEVVPGEARVVTLPD